MNEANLIPPRVRILIATVANLPEGGGHTSRLKTLAGCLVRQGYSVRIWSKHVLGHMPPEMTELRGVVEGAEYEIISKSKSRTFGARSFFMKVWTTLKLTVKLIRARRSIDVLWLNELTFHDMLPLIVLGRLFNMKIVQSYEDEHISICSERALTWRQRWFTGIDNRLADKFLVRRAEAVVVISRYLEKKFAACGARNLTLIPTIVDANYWKCESPPDGPLPRFFYSGSFMDIYALPETLLAMGELRSEGFDFEFHCIGNLRNQTPDLKKILRLRDECGLADRMEISDLVPLSEMRKQLVRSNFLLSIRKDSLLSCSGLSTKLSEYLASGRPVVTSAVGDVDFYLQDGVNAIVLANPTKDTIKQALKKCLMEPEAMQRIAAGGLAVAKSCFGYDVVGRKLDELLAPLLGARSGPQ